MERCQSDILTLLIQGRFDQYKEARNKRNDLNSNEFPGPFVTAYNFGKRITVQEALIISKQNWIP